MILNSGHTPNLWCYCAETAADIYRYTLHSAINTSPYEAWYGTKPSISDLCVWGCVVYVKVPSPKKSEDHVTRGYFMGFTKSCLLIRWLDPASRHVKHAFAVKFDEYCTPTSSTDHVSPGSLLLSSHSPPIVHLPEFTINVSDQPSFASPIFHLTVLLPSQDTPLGCTIMTCTYHNLPYIQSCIKGSPLASSLSPHGHHNSTYWILSINHTEFSTAEAAAGYISSSQLPNTTTTIIFILALRQDSTRSKYADNIAIFNQIRLSYHTNNNNNNPLNITNNNTTIIPTIVPTGLKVVILPERPLAPNHIGQLSSHPLSSD
jgi:hypothetical protein